ncbi:galactinol synthase 2 [Prunus dulcis]|uniref:Hexosyltransferase n=1 Tax=Prunus dulcis TaxID=3755 RepID=A0A5H2XRF9_PRUDU|nr:galactinol synthase 2 [Prunus dulcis]
MVDQNPLQLNHHGSRYHHRHHHGPRHQGSQWPSRAYVTFLAGTGDYVKGVVGLAKGLRKVKSKYPLVVAILPDVPKEHRQILVSQGCIVKEIEPVYPPPTRLSSPWPTTSSTTPSCAFGSKMIYLDGDIQVFQNIDHLFDYPDGYFYAVMDCFCEKTWSSSPQYKIGYCQQCPDKVQWSLSWAQGLLSTSTLACLCMSQACPFTMTSSEPSKFLPPPLLLSRDKYKPIPSNYNLVLAMLWRHPENIQLDQVKVVHYCADGSKPWRYTGKEENMEREDIKMLVKKWWDIYDDESLDFKNIVAAAEAGNGADQVDLQAFKAALSEAGVVNFRTAPSAA